MRKGTTKCSYENSIARQNNYQEHVYTRIIPECQQVSEAHKKLATNSVGKYVIRAANLIN